MSARKPTPEELVLKQLTLPEIELEPTPTPEMGPTLWDEAAEMLLGQMPERVSQILRETAQMQAIALWQLVVGLLQKAYDLGEHTAPVLNPEWMFSATVQRTIYPEKECECGCGTLFTPRWPGQIYAANECGTLVVARARERAHRERVGKASYMVGQEPEGAARSTIRRDETPNTGDGTALVQSRDVAATDGVVS